MSLVGHVVLFFGLAVLARVINCWLMKGFSVLGFPFHAPITRIVTGKRVLSLEIICEWRASSNKSSQDRQARVVGATISEALS